MFRPLVVALALAAAVAAPAAAQREQDSAYKMAKEGQIMELGDDPRRRSARTGRR